VVDHHFALIEDCSPANATSLIAIGQLTTKIVATLISRTPENLGFLNSRELKVSTLRTRLARIDSYL